MRDLAPKMTPEHLDRIQPRAVGRQIQQYEPLGRPTNETGRTVSGRWAMVVKPSKV